MGSLKVAFGNPDEERIHNSFFSSNDENQPVTTHYKRQGRPQRKSLHRCSLIGFKSGLL